MRWPRELAPSGSCGAAQQAPPQQAPAQQALTQGYCDFHNSDNGSDSDSVAFCIDQCPNESSNTSFKHDLLKELSHLRFLLAEGSANNSHALTDEPSQAHFNLRMARRAPTALQAQVAASQQEAPARRRRCGKRRQRIMR